MKSSLSSSDSRRTKAIGLAQQANQIGKVLEVIRASDTGRGFAVVADEVATPENTHPPGRLNASCVPATVVLSSVTNTTRVA